MLRSLRSLSEIVRNPVLAETRRNLARNWARLPDRLRTPVQMLGRQGNGCGGTIGMMPRCDFACRGCYLGDEANRIPAEPVEAIKAQMRLLRPALGNAGNLQLTDGEVTLRPEHELIELVKYALSLGLIPMLMTHGDSFRRRPGLLERLMVEGGLFEVSLHIDTTQRGRKGAAYKYAATEEELNPLRDEFAQAVRRARAATNKPLRCAMSMTVTPDNLSGVPAVMRWLLRNGDAFRLISFQPAAQVGRTVQGLDGVSVEALWRKIAEGLYGAEGEPEPLRNGHVYFGHPACNRVVPGLVAHQPGSEPSFHPIRVAGDPVDERAIDGFLRRFGGVTFRRDSVPERIARMVGLFVTDPRFAMTDVPRYLAHLARRIDPDRPLGFICRLLAGRATVHNLVIASHHFMSRQEIETALGRERLTCCVFHVPVGDTLVPMCEVNALGVRERHYADLAAGREPRQAADAMGS